MIAMTKLENCGIVPHWLLLWDLPASTSSLCGKFLHNIDGKCHHIGTEHAVKLFKSEHIENVRNL